MSKIKEIFTNPSITVCVIMLTLVTVIGGAFYLNPETQITWMRSLVVYFLWPASVLPWLICLILAIKERKDV